MEKLVGNFALAMLADLAAEEIKEINDRFNCVGLRMEAVENDYGEYLLIYADDDKFNCAMKRNAGRKQKLLSVDDTELADRVKELGIEQVARESGVSTRTIRRRIAKWQ